MIFVYNLVNVLFSALFYFILAHIILSWLPKDNPTLARINEIVDSVVLPIFRPFRKVVPVIDLGGIGFDLTPIVVIILLNISKGLILSVLAQLI